MTLGAPSVWTNADGSTSIPSDRILARRCQIVLALDIDGVLLDPNRHGQGSWQRALERRYAVEPEELNTRFFGPHWDSIVTGRRPLVPVLDATLDVLGWPMSTDELLAFWFESDFAVNHDVIDAVNRWVRQGAHAVLLTNQEALRAGFLWERLSRILAVDAMLYSGQLGLTKDHESFFARASRLLDVEPGTRVVFVDDAICNVHAAQAHGWRAVHFSREDDWQSTIASELTMRQSRAM